MKQKPWHYADICRGRYLCEDHGGFCDGADNYVPFCPECGNEKDARKKWSENRVDRLLHLVNGLQKRSARNASLVSAILGGFGALGVLSSYLKAELDLGAFANSVSILLVRIGLATLVLSVGMYLASMAQIRITDNKIVPEKTVESWEEKLASNFSFLETWHARAGICFLLAVIFFFLALVAPVLCELYEMVENCCGST